jgi:MFS family permease
LTDPAPQAPPDEAAASSGDVLQAATRSTRPRPGPTARVLTPAFLLIWGATFTFFISFYILLPTIPLYAVTLGATQAQVGLVIGLLEAASVLARPCVAPAIDRRRRKPFMLAGALIFAVSGVLYPLAATMPRLLALRVFHGTGMGIFMTAATSLIADGAPPARRGEALGAYGLAINLAMAIAPAAGMAVVNRASFLLLFFVSAAMGLAAMALAAIVPEAGGRAGATDRNGQRGPFISRAALFPSAIVFAQTVTYGAVLSFVPLWARTLEMENPGVFFTVFALALIAFRTQAGKLSDRFGRRAVVVPGLGTIAMAMVFLSLAGRPWHILAAGIVFGVGMGAVTPSLAAFLTDRAPASERARAFATYYGSFELGIAVGSVALGWVLAATTFPAMWLVSAAIAVLGAGAFLWGTGRHRPPRK